MTPPDTSTHALPFPAARRPTARPEAQPAASGLVAERLKARQRRVSQIRRRVAAIAAATFLATTGGVFVQLATGNDPALAAAAAKAAATTASTSSGTTSGSSSTSSSTTSGSSSSGKATAVTTSQS